jgi:hypothetical protein
MASEVTRSGHKPVGLTFGEQRQEWGSAPPSGDKKPTDKNSPKCGACGKHHTEPGITHESAAMNCMRKTIVQQRQEIAGLKIEIEAMRKRLRAPQ